MTAKWTDADVLTVAGLEERWGVERAAVDQLVVKGLPRLECGRFNWGEANSWRKKYYSRDVPAGWGRLDGTFRFS